MRDSPLAPNDLQLRAVVRWRWFETLLLTAAVPVGRFAAGSADPFVLGGSFPWLVFVPFAIGLQHGLCCAIASVLAIVAVAVVHAAWAGVPLPPVSVGFACGAIALVATRACDAQRERCERLRMRVVQLERAWERERRARALLRAPHGERVERSAGSPTDLDLALSSVEFRLAAAPSMREFGRVLLDLLVHRGELQEGSVWLESGGRCVPVATTRSGADGLGKRIPKPSPLVAHAMRTRSVVTSLDRPLREVSAGTDAEGEDALAAMPLISADGAVRGAVLVEQMPLESFAAGELQTMSVLVHAGVAVVEPETWERWMAELQRVRTHRDPRNEAAAGAGRWDAIA